MGDASPEIFERRPRFCVEGYTCSKPEEPPSILLTGRFTGFRLNIEISLHNFRTSPSRTEEFHKYFKAVTSENEGISDSETDDYDAVNDLFYWAMEPFLVKYPLKAVAPRVVTEQPEAKTLQYLLYPETWHCDLCAEDDVLCAGSIERQDFEDYEPRERIESRIEAMGNFLFIHPSRIEVYQDPEFWEPDEPDRSVDHAHRTRVSVDDQLFFFRSAEAMGVEPAMREIGMLAKIAGLAHNIRVPRLYGIVQDERNALIGILFDYIDEKDDLLRMVERDTPMSLKEKWTAQITEIVAALHSVDVTWGDAEAANVLVDVNNDLWVVDFAGGYGERWVDAEKVETVEGDLQGLANIVKFISDPDQLRGPHARYLYNGQGKV